MIRIKCPKCQKVLAIEGAAAGDTGTCPMCGAKFRIAGGASKAAPGKAPAAARPAANSAAKPSPAAPRKPAAGPGSAGIKPADRGAARSPARNGGPASPRKASPDEDVLEDFEVVEDDFEVVDEGPPSKKPASPKKKPQPAANDDFEVVDDGFEVVEAGDAHVASKPLPPARKGKKPAAADDDDVEVLDPVEPGVKKKGNRPPADADEDEEDRPRRRKKKRRKKKDEEESALSYYSGPLAFMVGCAIVGLILLGLSLVMWFRPTSCPSLYWAGMGIELLGWLWCVFYLLADDRYIEAALLFILVGVGGFCILTVIPMLCVLLWTVITDFQRMSKPFLVMILGTLLMIASTIIGLVKGFEAVTKAGSDAPGMIDDDDEMPGARPRPVRPGKGGPRGELIPPAQERNVPPALRELPRAELVALRVPPAWADLDARLLPLPCAVRSVHACPLPGDRRHA
jgi:hypothetical protein